MGGYVRFMQAAGARVVPIVRGEPKEVTIEKLGKLNGVLLPGGNGDYIEMSRTILDYAKEQNDKGKFYPLWGTCQGYEYMSIITAKNQDDVLKVYGVEKVSLPVKFMMDPRDTKMFCPLGLEAFRF